MGKPAGRPPKPVESKRRTGNPGHRKLGAALGVTDIRNAAAPPAPVRALGDIGRDFWDRAWAAGAAWVSPTTDVDMLQMICEQLDERQGLRVQVFRDVADWRNRLALRALDKQIADGLSMLGFTPTDRARIGAREAPHVDELDEFRRRVAARRSGI